MCLLARSLNGSCNKWNGQEQAEPFPIATLKLDYGQSKTTTRAPDWISGTGL